MSEHRKVGDIVFTHKVTGQGFEGEMMMTFDSIQVNVPVPDSLFVMPADARPLPQSLAPAAGESGD
jgi:hypothetical protein